MSQPNQWAVDMIGSVADVCECPVLPVNRWRRPGEGWEPGRPIGIDSGWADGEAFNAGGYNAWLIQCPECGQVYARGGEW